MHKMFHLTREPKRRNTTPESRVPAWFLYQMLCHGPSKAAAKTEVSGSSKQLHLKDQNTGIPGTAGVAGHSTRLVNRKADCCPLLKRITKLKCVNSEFKTVNAHPEKGCLKWLHGTMSEPPWKSH